MGNWNLSVQGVGCHHNTTIDNPTDADRMFAKFVDDLRAAGHYVQFASMTHGSAQIESLDDKGAFRAREIGGGGFTRRDPPAEPAPAAEAGTDGLETPPEVDRDAVPGM